jgi:DeoR family suf operon transcriptional repressor
MPLDTLPPTRRALLLTLKRKGEAGADELARTLGITVSAVRQHVAVLQGDGLVEHREERAGPGRPKHRYRLTVGAEPLFPKMYGPLTTELLSYVEDESPAMVDRLFERRRHTRVERARSRLAGLDPGRQVAELTRILDEDGYLADAERMPDGAWRIVEHNCAILEVAARYGQACGAEIDFIRAVLPGATVERTEHLLSGAHVCAYEVRFTG